MRQVPCTAGLAGICDLANNFTSGRESAFKQIFNFAGSNPKVVADGKIVASGTPDQVRHSTDPFVRQFVDGQPDGPVRLHYPAEDYASQLGLGGRHG